MPSAWNVAAWRGAARNSDVSRPNATRTSAPVTTCPSLSTRPTTKRWSTPDTTRNDPGKAWMSPVVLMVPPFLLLPPPHALATTRPAPAARNDRRLISTGTRGPYPADVAIRLRVDGRDVEVADDGASLLEVLR